jgi:CRP-like cAMP-binding protein
MAHEKAVLIGFIQQVFPMPMAMAETIVEYFHREHFKKGDYLLTEGKICPTYHLLEEGLVRAYTHDREGNDVTTAFYSGNGVVCEIFSFFKRVPSRENFQALTDCATWAISFEGLQEVFHNLPAFREFGRTVLVNAYAQLKLHALSSLHNTAEERYLNLLNTHPDVFQHAQLKQIASYLGVTDTSLSRIRKEVTKVSSSR